MRLDQYLTQQKIPAAAFKAAIRVASVNTVYRYRRHENIPEPEIMRRIYVVTGGRVQPNDFYDLPNLKTAENQRGRSKAAA
ncbi:MAG: hypothetical protein U1A72_16940 [Sulfuritalea sp.]|nr:hypothetical protein [Sulfuritalea sp.]